MTWTLASTLLLLLALGGLLAWYERTKPPSRVVALIATLAALAALGRIAFAPLPNVKPTTDIVALAGFALGPVPGAVVGALGALASNLVFGQGPWTPWQMAGWGLCGLLGGWLGLVTARRVGRLGLAVFCAGLGLLYGLVLDFHLWALYSGHSFAEWAVINARGLPFNVAHAAGNFAFALLFAPVLVRALLRFRERLDVRWLAAPAAVALAFAAAPVEPAEAASPTGYLLGAQNRDGGLGVARGRGSDALNTAWAAMGLAAAGRHPARVRRGGRSLADRVAFDARRVRDTGDIERTILALRASGRSTARLERRLAGRQRRDGSWEALVNRTAFGVLALRAAGRSARSTRVRPAARWLERAQNRDGGWGVTRGGRSGIDDTAGVLQAIVAVRGRRVASVRRATAFLLRSQNPDGGFPLSRGAGSNAQSTAWAAQALTAAGRTASRVRRRGSRDPLSFLRSLTQRDGSVRYSRRSAQTPVWVTAQALTALTRRPFPIRAPR